ALGQFRLCRRYGVRTFCGLKARHVTAWGEAHGAKPQVKIPNMSSPPCKGGTLVGNVCSVPALQASQIKLTRVSRASARDARSSPGCHIAGFQPASKAGRKCPNSRADYESALRAQRALRLPVTPLGIGRGVKGEERDSTNRPCAAGP